MTTETRFEIGDTVKVTVPQRSGRIWEIVGVIEAKRSMRATGRTFFAVNGRSGFRAEWLTLVKKADQ